ncbi:MAG: TonB-dependent receptor [Bacteroidales bacterium]|nr:TonB-dependent receptor [Bacteroidales bacterium]
MNSIKGILKRALILIISIIATQSIFAQTVISGTVFDQNGEAVIGATVYNRARGEGAATDVNGVFRFETKDKLPIELEVSSLGYNKKLITISSTQEQSIILEEESQQISDVVVVGYGTQKRTQLTGAVTTIKADIFENSTSPTLDGALSGAVAGLNVTSASGQPGASSNIRIRGGNSVNASNEPLYVVDGFIYFRNPDDNGTGLGAIEGSLNPLATINPSDIESIEVLKDVSATAIYGSRGANGVILVTTKKGVRGKTSVIYGYSAGVDVVRKKLDLLDAQQWAGFQKQYYFNKGGYTDEQIKNLGKGTDWQDAMLRSAFHQTHELSVSGGNDKTRYAFSANYTDQDGIILNSGLKRYNFHINVDWELNKGLRLGVNGTEGKAIQKGLTTTEEVVYNSSPYSDGITNSFVYGLLVPPVVDVYNADGTYNYHNPYEYAYFAIGDKTSNPVSDLENSVAENINSYFLGNFWASYQIGELTIKAALGLNKEHLTQNYFSPSYTSLGLANTGLGGIGNRQTEIWQQEYTATWAHEFGNKHSLDALAGYTRQKSTSTHNSIMTTHFTNEELKQYNLADGSEIYSPKSGISESHLNSVIARVNYTFLSRYNVTATFRADNSSRFAATHRWGYFPSVGVSWNVDKERFLVASNVINGLKLRLSFGTVGNQEISDHAFSTSYKTSQYAGSSSYSTNNTKNDNLKWETTASYNAGVDADFFSRRLSAVLDFYFKKTRDLLLDVPMGFSSGVTSQIQNVGNVENKGIEFQLTGVAVKTADLTLNVSANIAHNSNTITNMGSTNNVILGSSKENILRKGESLGSFYGLKFAGIVKTTDDTSKLPTINGDKPKVGSVMYEDYNHDGRIDGNDRQILGSIQPDFTYGFSASLFYKGLDASLAFQGTHGNKVFNALGRRLEQTGDSYNVLKTVLNSWTKDNENATLPYASYDRTFSYVDSRYVEDASFLKLRNLTVGYRFSFKDKPFGIRVYATASNLLTISNYKGFDPEMANGTDSGAYPSSRSFTFGASINL